MGAIAEKKPHWNKLNPEKAKELNRLWHLKNPHKAIEYRDKWRSENRDQLLALKRASYHRNKATRKAYNEVNAERIRETAKLYKRVNRDKLRAAARAYHAKNPEKVKAWNQESRRRNRGAYLFYGIKKSCRKLGLELDITKEWLQQRIDLGLCEMTGLPFDLSGKRSKTSPSVDRYDPKGGYTRDNCAVIIWFLNRAFSNINKDEALDVFEAALRKKRPHLFVGNPG